MAVTSVVVPSGLYSVIGSVVVVGEASFSRPSKAFRLLFVDLLRSFGRFNVTIDRDTSSSVCGMLKYFELRDNFGTATVNGQLGVDI